MIFLSILFLAVAHLGAMETKNAQVLNGKTLEKKQGSLAKLITESKALDNLWIDPSRKPTASQLEQWLGHYSLDNREISDLQSYLEKSNQLRIIQLGTFAIKRFDHAHLLHITHLDLSHNKLTSLDGLETLPLVYFNGCNNQLNTFPKAILGWQKTLKKLNLASNQIAKIDDLNGTFECLQEIDMSENPIAYIPEKGLEELHKKQKGNFSITINNESPKKFIVGATMSGYFILNMRTMIKGNADLTVKV
jgi:Leucine-rich repeat (LRR) protein